MILVDITLDNFWHNVCSIL